MKLPFPHLIAAILFVSGFIPARAQSIDVNATAAYLAGIRPPGHSPLAPLVRDAAWQQHATSFDQAWAKIYGRYLSPIRTWAATDLGRAYRQRATIYYMFSGPDFLYVNAFFPSGSTYVLCGKEEVGDVPSLLTMSPADRTNALRNIQATLNTVLKYSYFITKDMRTDLARSSVRGVTPILLVFMARSGKVIREVSMIGLDRSGRVSSRGRGRAPGVRIVYSDAGSGPAQTLYYFDSDLSNSGINSHPGVMNFCRARGAGISFLKSASYLMHRNSFSEVRSMLLDLSLTVVQDDSGIPIRYFDSNRWIVRFYGNYIGPIALFKEHYQQDLAELYRRSRPKPLSFGVGYRFNASQTTLMVATRK